MNFKFKVENAFREVWKRVHFQLKMSTLKYSSFSYISPLNLVDKWNYEYTWEDLSTSSNVVLGIIRKYLQKYFIWSEDLFKNCFTIYLYFILKVCQQSCEYVYRRVFECKLNKLLGFVLKEHVYDCSIKKQDSCSESIHDFIKLIKVV